MAAASRSGGRSGPAGKSAKKVTRTAAKVTTASSAKKAPPPASKKPAAKAATKAATKAVKKAPEKPVAKAAAKKSPATTATKAAAKGSIRAQPVPVPLPVPASAPPSPTLTEPVDPATLHLTAAPVLHRILTCHVPVAAITRLEAGSPGESVFSAARNALQAGIHALEQELRHEPSASGAGAGRPTAVQDERPHTRPMAVPAGLAAALLVTRLAEECFDGDVHVAGGWLVARGAGHPATLPTPHGAATRRSLTGAIKRLAASERSGKSGKTSRATKPAAPAAIVSGARVSAPLILVPAGPQLRAMREALGVTREQVAQVAGLTPDTVGEIERDKRPTAAARLRVAEVLCGMNPATRLMD